MCLICVSFEQDRLTVQEARRNLGEMRESLDPEHVEEVESMIREKEDFVTCTYLGDERSYTVSVGESICEAERLWTSVLPNLITWRNSLMTQRSGTGHLKQFVTSACTSEDEIEYLD